MRGFLGAALQPDATRSGVEAISSLHRNLNPDDSGTMLLTCRKAGKSVVFRLAPRARYLHIATHGYFGPESVRGTGRTGSVRHCVHVGRCQRSGRFE